MNPRFAAQLLDRIAELAKGKEERLFNYLEQKERMTATNAEHQQALRARREAEGLKRFTLWLNQQDSESLKQRYPGPKGGVDWSAVIRAALEPQAQPDDEEIERLQRKIRQLEKDHKRGIENWRQTVDDLESKLAKAQDELKKLNPDQGG